MPLRVVDRDHNLTPLRSVDDTGSASLPAGTWIVYPTVRDAAQKHHPGFGATSKDAALALFAATDAAGSIDWDGPGPERDWIRAPTRRAEPLPRHLSSGRSIETYCTAKLLMDKRNYPSRSIGAYGRYRSLARWCVALCITAPMIAPLLTTCQECGTSLIHGGQVTDRAAGHPATIGLLAVRPQLVVGHDRAPRVVCPCPTNRPRRHLTDPKKGGR